MTINGVLGGGSLKCLSQGTRRYNRTLAQGGAFTSLSWGGGDTINACPGFLYCPGGGGGGGGGGEYVCNYCHP